VLDNNYGKIGSFISAFTAASNVRQASNPQQAADLATLMLQRANQ
jgi:hypothetical protein